MGASSSTVMETISETVNKTTIDILNQNENNARQAAVSVQESKLEGLEIAGCQLDISQQSTATLKSMQSITASVASDLVAKISSALAASAEATVSAESALGSQPSNSASVQRAISSVTNEMKANLTAENINKLIQDVNMKQKQDITGLKYDACNGTARLKILQLPGFANSDAGKEVAKGINACYAKDPLPKCNISQITSANLVADQITTSVMDIIAKNEAVNEAKTDFKAKSDAKSKGVGDMLGDILKGLFSGLFGGLFGGLGSYAMMVSVCCCVCCCCLILLMVGGSMMAGGGKGAAPTANAGSGTNNLSPELR